MQEQMICRSKSICTSIIIGSKLIQFEFDIEVTNWVDKEECKLVSIDAFAVYSFDHLIKQISTLMLTANDDQIRSSFCLPKRQ